MVHTPESLAKRKKTYPGLFSSKHTVRVNTLTTLAWRHVLSRRSASPASTVILLAMLSIPLPASADCVVLLHGLARTSGSMEKLIEPFEELGHQVINVNYPSRKKTVEELSSLAVEELGYSNCQAGSVVNIVTHSMGGILARYYLQHNEIPQLGRVVMMAPPNQGSEVVDNLRGVPGFKLINGEAGMQLGTDASGIPAGLGAVDFELGVIAGTKTVNPLLSQFLPNPDDGKVSVASTRVEGMDDHIVLPVNHTFMMRSKKVIEQVLHFIAQGRFDR